MDATMTTPEETRLRAVRARDPSADGTFFYAVLTTGVFCYPSCAARPARLENLRFFDTREAAAQAGYRPCRRCRPDLPPRAQRRAEATAAACRAIEQGTFNPDHAGEEAGLARAAFIRLFREITGVTPTAYAAARRQHVTQSALRAGAAVTDAIYEAGFSSSGRFYEAADGMLGMTPTQYRAGGAGETITYAFGASTLGQVLVATSTRGICAILLGDDPTALRADLAHRFPRATLAEAAPASAARVAEVVRLIDTPSAAHALPLDIRGTAFQHKVWQALRAIPAGETRSYAAIAQAVGKPGAARAVGTACGANRLAVAIPCHRVLAAGGDLAGYAWGKPRKAALLAREQKS
jgi:AraC family transcriptional regulator, regulatory protein of adaptative response / methylated-DNA-[protein]-cysteine methyltransferase